MDSEKNNRMNSKKIAVIAVAVCVVLVVVVLLAVKLAGCNNSSSEIAGNQVESTQEVNGKENETESATENVADNASVAPESTVAETQESTETVTESVKETEAQTETQKLAEKQTEEETEKATQKLPETEKETETETKKVYLIPAGATYYDASEDVTLVAGQPFPEPSDKDSFVFGDYKYRYVWLLRTEGSLKGWSPEVIDKTKETYGEVVSYVGAVPVNMMLNTYEECYNMKTVPAVPDTVVEMLSTYRGCRSLVSAPAIPLNVTAINFVYSGCTSLKTVGAIHSGVTRMGYLFEKCYALTGDVVIDANPRSYTACFSRVYIKSQKINLTGSSTMLEELRATGAK